MRNKFEFKVSTGITSILMIFVVLCLTAFGVLSFLSAKADLNLSEKNSQNIINYYNAESKITEKLSEIDGVLLDASVSANNSNEYFEKINQNILKKFGEGSYDLETNKITIDEKINEKQSLELIVTVLWDETDARYSVESLKVKMEQGEYGNEKIPF